MIKDSENTKFVATDNQNFGIINGKKRLAFKNQARIILKQARTNSSGGPFSSLRWKQIVLL